jgi:two-component system cell cycle response regulator
MKLTVLIIEDNQLNMKLFRSLLSKGDFQIIEATDGENGIEMAKVHLPDLILMDIQLPKMDGLQATRLIKKDPVTANIPIVALTSHAMLGDDEKAKEAGCSGYITKPIDTRSFLSNVSRYLTNRKDQLQSSNEMQMEYKPKVLIVDDEPNNVKLMSAMLYKEPVDIITANNGKTALEIVNNTNIDLILLDIMMPEMDGYQVTQLIRENKKTKNIPIILVTALHGSEDKKRGLDVGADEFITKPVNKIEIIARIRSMLKLNQYREQMIVRKKSEEPFTIPLLNPVSARNTSQCVLLVEDDIKDSKLIQQLVFNEPYRLKIVTTGEEAIELAQHEKIDLILLDIILPKMDGYQVCQYLKNNTSTCDIQIVMISCLADLESKLKGVEEGVDDFLVKPIDSRQLRSRINALLKKKSYLDQLQMHRDKVIGLAITDGLTQLYNQSYFKRYVEIEIARALNRDYLIGLLMADLDNFKKYNDTLGHVFGDNILKEVAKIIKMNIREIDFPARYGGEEFVVVFPYADTESVLRIAEKIRKSVENHIFPEASTLQLSNITVSIGIAFCPTDATKADDLIEKADYMLYRAKKSGKNQVCIGHIS